MQKTLLYCIFFFVFIFVGCEKSDSFKGSGDGLIGEWNVRTLSGNDVSSLKMTLNFKEYNTMLAFDGCNWGFTPYTTGTKNSLQMGYPSFTYMYCNQYHGVFGNALKAAKKYSVGADKLSFHSQEGELLLVAIRK